MVLIQYGTRWIAFNPKTCSIQKVWEGSVDWRGKVYDFSQDSSRSKGKVLFELPSNLWQQDAFWTAKGTAKDNTGLLFTESNAAIQTPKLDFSHYQNIYVAFDETSRAAPFRVEVVEEGGDWFDSTKHGHSDTDWQWNFKQVWPKSQMAAIRWTGPAATAKKKLRNARVFGDYKMFTSNRPLEVIWKGYRYHFDQVALNVELKIGDNVVRVGIVAGPDQFRISSVGDLRDIWVRVPFGLELVNAPKAESYPMQNEMTLKLAGGTR